jgi:hypothetical protein
VPEPGTTSTFERNIGSTPSVKNSLNIADSSFFGLNIPPLLPLRFVPLRFVPLRFVPLTRRIDLFIVVLLFYSLAFLLYFIKFHICQKIDAIQSFS